MADEIIEESEAPKEDFVPELDTNTEYEWIDAPDDADPEDQPGFDPANPHMHQSWLFREFKILGKTAAQIAQEVGVSENTIKLKLNEFQFEA